MHSLRTTRNLMISAASWHAWLSVLKLSDDCSLTGRSISETLPKAWLELPLPRTIWKMACELKDLALLLPVTLAQGAGASSVLHLDQLMAIFLDAQLLLLAERKQVVDSRIVDFEETADDVQVSSGTIWLLQNGEHLVGSLIFVKFAC
ncbi:uncharacterized protein DMAD_11963 [Drosophila madeirensis]|uniref:Uncharacterized protein n=1 Tax=Drosophila madeirensis TaxID=30013 RepID=A0AAU9FF72_DROMD